MLFIVAQWILSAVLIGLAIWKDWTSAWILAGLLVAAALVIRVGQGRW